MATQAPSVKNIDSWLHIPYTQARKKNIDQDYIFLKNTQAPRSIEKCHTMITYSMTTQPPKKHCIMITDAYSSTYNKRILHHDYIFQMTTQAPKIKKDITSWLHIPVDFCDQRYLGGQVHDSWLHATRHRHLLRQYIFYSPLLLFFFFFSLTLFFFFNFLFTCFLF